MNKRVLFSDHSWNVEFLPKERAILVETTDYHAKPLQISLEELGAFIRACGPSLPDGTPSKLVSTVASLAARPAAPTVEEPVAAESKVPPPPERAQSVASPRDLAVIITKDAWTVSVSKRDRTALVACAGCAGTPLALSRGELYRVGKSMGKRGGGSRGR